MGVLGAAESPPPRPCLGNLAGVCRFFMVNLAADLREQNSILFPEEGRGASRGMEHSGGTMPCLCAGTHLGFSRLAPHPWGGGVFPRAAPHPSGSGGLSLYLVPLLGRF